MDLATLIHFPIHETEMNLELRLPQSHAVLEAMSNCHDGGKVIGSTEASHALHMGMFCAVGVS